MHPTEAQAATFYQYVIERSGNTIWTCSPGYPDPASIAPTRVEQIATLHCPTGRIIACDPSYSPDSCQPFVDQFPVGSWPLFLCGAVEQTSSGTNYWLPIGSYIAFRPDAPTIWRLALCAGQTMDALAEDEFWCFGVDGGRACFMDTAALLPWHDLIHSASYLEQFTKPIDWTPPRIEDESFQLSTGAVANVVSFQAGYGDGCYPCFVGENDSGQMCMLLMQFDVFDSEVYTLNSTNLSQP